jgi:alcohol dehydrogenase class IV
MWYFKSPEVVFGEEALAHIAQMVGSRAFIITDPTLAQLGVAARIEALFADAGFTTATFAEVEPEPSLQTVRRGAEAATAFAPDWIVGLGGGSPLDAAKAIWAMYERPDLDATEINPMINLNFSKSRMVAIPTTSGTGSEATWAVVLTDVEERRKFSTGSREIVPTLAIIDPSLTQKLPPRITADTGLDALTHAIEGFTCSWHNDFSDGPCLKAAELVLGYLERAYCNGENDAEAREKMANAATLAGLGFGNANLGLAHAMGHSFGAYFKKPHGRAVALFLPYIMEFSANGGAGRYGEMARFVGLTESRDEETGARLLIDRVRSLQQAVEQPMSMAAMGVSATDFEDALETLCDHAGSDTQFFTAPRIPEPEELERLFHAAYTGTPVTF